MLRCLLTLKARSNVFSHIGGAPLNRHNHTLLDVCHSSEPSSSTEHSDLTSKECEDAVQTVKAKSRGSKGSLLTATERLSRLISEKNVHSSQPQLETIHDIKNLYYTAKANDYLTSLSSEELSSLIRLFGTLSLSPNLRSTSLKNIKITDYSLHPLASPLVKRSSSSKDDYWAVVISISKDKRQLGYSLSKVDNYWLMHAALDEAYKYYSKGSSDVDIVRCLGRAKTHYLLLKASKEDNSLHRIYISKLLLIGPNAADEIIYRLSILFDWNKGLHSYFLGTLWRVLSRYGNYISNPTKQHLLKVLRKRLDKLQDILPTPLSDHAVADVVRRYDSIAIRDYFADLLFSHHPRTKDKNWYLRLIYSWAVFECRAALCTFNDGSFSSAEEQDTAAWQNLILLSLSYTAGQDSSNATVNKVKPEQGLDGGIHSQVQVLGWSVICSLAALTSELYLHDVTRRPFNLDSPESVQEIARTLWILWRKEEAWRAGAVERRMPLVCSATTSFMALASYSKDVRLASALARHISNAIISPAQYGGEVLNRSMLETCATYYALMCVTVGVNGPPHRNWSEILNSLRYIQLIPDGESPRAKSWASIVANALLKQYCRVDCLHSFNLMRTASEHDLVLDADTVYALGDALITEGYLEPAFECLRDYRISAELGSKLLDTLLKQAQTRWNVDYQLVGLFVKVFTETPVRPSSNDYLESFILTCTRLGFNRESDIILRVICESNKGLLRPQFLSQYLSVLAQRRRYRLLGSLLQSTWRREPSRLSMALRQPKLRFIHQLLHQEGAKTNSRDIIRSLPFSIYIWPLMRAHIPFHPRLALLDRKVLTLKLNNAFKKEKTLDEKTLEHAIYLMVNAGRITSAIKLSERFQPKISTKAGNIILSASLRPKRSRRNRRQIRHASARLTKLVEQRGFEPDRVTLNLLFKALLRWKNITPPVILRALFDKLVVSGYPLPVRAPPEGTRNLVGIGRRNSQQPVGLFGVSNSTVAQLPVDLKPLAKGISFAKHTRPLYRMFKKAFEARGDTEGAQRVAGLLRSVKMVAAHEYQKRERARQMGRMLAKKRRTGSKEVPKT